MSELEPSSRGLDIRRTGPARLLQPEFVIVGIAVAGGVLVFGSTTLDDAELRRRIEGLDLVPLGGPGSAIARLPKEKITLTVTMRDFIQVYGDTYPAALRSLLSVWDQQRAAALPPGKI